MLPDELKYFTEELLSKNLGNDFRIKGVSSIGGGSINRAVQLKTTAGFFFLKFNNARLYPQMFELEKRGLELLHQADEILVPEVMHAGEVGEFSFLILQFIDSGLKQSNFWRDFGSSLAGLHKHTTSAYGLNHDNYIGSLTQSNGEHSSWAEFFIEERLKPQVEQARLSSDVEQMFNMLYLKIDELFPVEVPALLHGDLWSGNYMTSSDGSAVIIDPAIYYGNREMDIGMTKLFGGFSEGFYDAYNEAYPMEPGWEGRVDICNLYPLMVHVNLFGGSYLSQVTSILRKYTR